MHARVRAQIDQLRGSRHRPHGGIDNRIRIRHEGNHGSIVIVIDVPIQNKRILK